MKGDARTSGEQRRKEGGNIFSNQIRVGIAIYFLVRKKGLKVAIFTTMQLLIMLLL